MANIVKLPSGNWRVQIRSQQKSISKTFRLKSQAQRWATEQHDRADRGETPTTRDIVKTNTIGELIELHIDDMAEVGKAAQRSKEMALLRLQYDRDVGMVRVSNFNRERVIAFDAAGAPVPTHVYSTSPDLLLRAEAYDMAALRLLRWRQAAR